MKFPIQSSQTVVEVSRSKFPTLDRLGVAVEYFPKYINRKCHLHGVDVALLSYTVGGRGLHVMDGEEYEEMPGSIGITHYGQVHDIVTDGKGIEIYNVYLDLRNHPFPVLPEALHDVMSIILPLHPRLCHRMNRRVHLRLENEREIASLLKRMIHEQEIQDGASYDVIQALLGVFLVELCRAALRHGVVASVLGAEKSAGWLERLRGDLDKHYRDPLTLPELARKMGMHPSYLCRAFKRHTGTTVMAYLNMRRVQASMVRLCANREDKIIKIALDCGFNDLAYFNRKFKAITGKTPTQYRLGSEAPKPS